MRVLAAVLLSAEGPGRQQAWWAFAARHALKQLCRYDMKGLPNTAVAFKGRHV